MRKILAFISLIAVADLNAQIIKNGDSIAFLGDSITQYGNLPGGYVQLVVAGLGANGIHVKSYPAGIAGEMSSNMLRRLEYSVLAKKPTWMTLSCGVNDSRHSTKSIPLDQFKKNVTAIVDKAQKANIKVMVLTATMIFENPNHPLNKKLAPYNDFLRKVAAEKKCVLADLNADMQAEVTARRQKAVCSENFLTRDGVHMNQAGNRMMAYGILKAFGLNKEQLAKAEAAWQGKAAWFRWMIYGDVKLTLAEFQKLQKICELQKKSLAQLLAPAVQERIKNLLSKDVKSFEVANSALIPTGRLERDNYNWDERHANILKKVGSKKYELVFIGDSITHHFENSKLWKEKLEPLKALNLGFGWDRTQNVIWRLEHGELKGQTPKLIVLNIGTNNFSGTPNARTNSPAEVAEAILRICDLLRKQVPDARILVMGVFPRGRPNAWNYQAIESLNLILKKELTGKKDIAFMNIGKSFMLPNGSLKSNLYRRDLVHLTDKGYENWLKEINPVISKYITNAKAEQ